MNLSRSTRLAAGALLFVVACKSKQEAAKPVAEGEGARRAAASFVHCVEGGNASCVRPGIDHTGWDAFFLMGWLGSGSPTSILEALPRQLTTHADPKGVQSNFVEVVERHAVRLRGAECNPVQVQPLAPLVAQVSEAAQRRMTALGLWGPDLQEVVAGLRAEADAGLRGGFLVSMQCKSEPYELYLGTNEEGQRHQVVGMMSVLPRFLGGDAVERANLADRLRSQSLNGGSAAPGDSSFVDRWIPIQMEEF